MAPAMSIRCITVPPRMNPRGLASLGSTTWTISVSDSDARFGCMRCDLRLTTYDLRLTTSPVPLKVIPDPHRESRFAEFVAATDRGERNVFPTFVEQRPPRPVEM